MKLGTKSLLFGAHAFWLHPWFVALGWLKLYGFRRIPLGSVHYVTRECGGMPYEEAVVERTSILSARLWFAFVLHDIGYWGAANMDGVEGKAHPYRGARWMGMLFGESWSNFVLRHSRSMARWLNRAPSALCHADKLAFNLTPRWLYLAMTRATGELNEYMDRAGIPNVDKHARIYWHMTVCDDLLAFASRREYVSKPSPRGF
jgi:hypothetical protein